MSSKQAKRRQRRASPAGGYKALISVGALATSLVGWGLLGKQELPEVSPSGSATFLVDLIHAVLGPLPSLLPRTSSGFSTERSTSGLVLRSVNAPNQNNQGSFRPSPITRTQSSR